MTILQQDGTKASALYSLILFKAPFTATEQHVDGFGLVYLEKGETIVGQKWLARELLAGGRQGYRPTPSEVERERAFVRRCLDRWERRGIITCRPLQPSPESSPEPSPSASTGASTPPTVIKLLDPAFYGTKGETLSHGADHGIVHEASTGASTREQDLTRRKRKERTTSSRQQQPEGFDDLVSRLRTEGIIKKGTLGQRTLIAEWCVSPGPLRVIALLQDNRVAILAAERAFPYFARVIQNDRQPQLPRSSTPSKGDTHGRNLADLPDA